CAARALLTGSGSWPRPPHAADLTPDADDREERLPLLSLARRPYDEEGLAQERADRSEAGKMANTADILIVGGGVIGSSIAFHLARRKAGRVLLLEKAYLAAGSSGKSGAIVRQHYS